MNAGHQPIQSRADEWFKAIIIGAIVGGSILWGVVLLTRSPSSTPVADMANNSPSPGIVPIPEPINTPTPEPTNTPTPEPTNTPTLEPTNTPTLEPTNTPTPEPTNTATPEPTNTPMLEPANTPTPEPAPEPTETFKASQQFPKQQCGDQKPSEGQKSYRVYVNSRDLETLKYLERNYCRDTFLRETRDVIQVASFQDPQRAEEFAEILKSDSNLNSDEVSWYASR